MYISEMSSLYYCVIMYIMCTEIVDEMFVDFKILPSIPYSLDINFVRFGSRMNSENTLEVGL
jgi:hypothetical protein